MITLGKREHVEEYFSTKRASQSFLKALLNGVNFLKEDEAKLYYEEKGHFIIGSAVDTQITMGQKEFNIDYFTSEVNKPSDTVVSIINKIFDEFDFEGVDVPPRLEDLPDQILESCAYHSYQPRYKSETKITKIVTEGGDYFQELIESRGKQILSSIESNIVSNIVMSFKSHRFTAKYFKDREGIDIFYQVPIYFEMFGVECKALLDMIIVDRKNKKVYPIDLKTMGGHVTGFPSAIKARRYDFQASFYSSALIELIDGRATSPVNLDITEYELGNFRFIVESTNYSVNKMTGEVSYGQGMPLVFELSANVMMEALNGRPECVAQGFTEESREEGIPPIYPIKFRPIKGIREALELYSYHEENGYEFDREVNEGDGKIVIDW